MEKIRIGLVSFTDPRSVDLASETERYNRKNHQETAVFLKNAGFEVLDPRAEAEFPTVRSSSEVREVVHALRAAGADGLIVGCWKWTDPMLAIELVRDLNVPTLLFARKDVYSTGIGCMSAIGAGLWEIAPNLPALRHRRILDDLDEVARWARGVGALMQLRRGNLLLWGGSYALRMEHLEDDAAKLKSFLVGDLLVEGQYLLIRRAEAILRDQYERVEAFIRWLEDQGTTILYDDRMLTAASFRKQIALLLAARQRLDELKDMNILGVSLRCQPELSEEYGVTGCTIPSFLPFGEDHEGPKPIVSTTCEGDIKGLITSTLMNLIQPDVPAAFGDIRHMEVDGRHLLMIGNCGGASIYYAANSGRAADVLPHVTIQGQCQGASGGAVGYRGIATTPATIARLIRINGTYSMQLGVGEAVDVTPDMINALRWGAMWPQVAIDLNRTIEDLIQVIGSNHYSLLPGDHAAEITYVCHEVGIPVTRIDRA